MLAIAIVGIRLITKHVAHNHATAASAQSAVAALQPSDWTVPHRFTGKLVCMRIRHFPEKIIALTFDDGPSPNITPRILDALAAHHAKATFFVLGNMAKRHPELLRRMLAQGDAIGDHSYSHPKSVSAAQAVTQINCTADIVLKATGRKPCCFRPPYGITHGNLAHVAQKEGYPVVTWTISTADSKHVPADAMVHNVLHTPNPGDIVLMHDAGDHQRTAEAVPVMLDQLTALGYKFVTLPELFRAWDKWQASMHR